MTKIGRNDKCPCGSGKKYKKCHMNIDKQTGTGYKTISRETFVMGPYIPCPFCKVGRYGILDIRGQSYTRECLDCKKRANYNLPSIKKKVIYLDHFVISKIADILDKKSPHYAQIRKDGYWLDLYTELHRLVIAQLAVFPENIYRFEESVTTPVFTLQKRMYEHLSCGIELLDHLDIVERQLMRAMRSYATKSEDTALHIEDATNDVIDKWEERIAITVTRTIRPSEKQDIESGKKFLENSLLQLADSWSAPNVTFKKLYTAELDAFGNGVIKHGYGADAFTNRFALMLLRLRLFVKKEFGINDTEASKFVQDFLLSNQPHKVPFINISAGLLASMEWQIRGGSKRRNPSIFNDINAVSAYLPYVDAVFVDNEVAGWLNSLIKRGILTTTTKIFSTSTRDAFLKYLKDIEVAVPPAHLTVVEEVYGKDWGKPYLSIIDRERERQ